MRTAVGRVTELWRYPVKSLGGELLPEAFLSAHGVSGDRRWAVRGADGKLGSGKTTRRFRRMPGLLGLSSVTEPDGSCSVVFPGGERLAVEDLATARSIEEVVGEPVTLSEERLVPHLDAAPVHLLTTSAMAWVAARQPGHAIERRRFRPNVVVDVAEPGRPEDDWVGRHVLVGGAELAVLQRTERCAMVTMAQPDLEPAPGLLRTLEHEADTCLGAYATVVRDGAVRTGDAVLLCD